MLPDDDIMVSLLRLDYGLSVNSDYPIKLHLGNPGLSWIASSCSVERLRRKARAQASAIDGIELIDYHLAMLLGGRMLSLGPMFPYAKPSLRTCTVCGHDKDHRLFGTDTPNSGPKGLCLSCRQRGLNAQAAKSRERRQARRREIVADLLKSQGFRSNVAIAHLARAGGYRKCTDGTVGKMRKELEASGTINPQPMRLARNGRVYIHN